MTNPDIWKHGFGSRPKEVDDEYRRRSKGVPKKRVWTKERCVETLDVLLTHLNKILKEDKKLEKNDPKKLKNEHISDTLILINKILDVMKYLYPPIQQNLNVNVDLTTDAVVERLKNWKKETIIDIKSDGK